MWRHGDWVTFTDDGSCVVSGRSDATLNRGGVRLGTSDFYAVVEGFDEVADSLVVHVEDAAGHGGLGELILFVKLADGVELTDDLRARASARRWRASCRRGTRPTSSRRCRPCPRTLSGKKLELPVKRILAGATAADVASRGRPRRPDARSTTSSPGRRP